MIVKLINKTGFAQIPNKTLRDKRLSLEARGALAEILSFSDEFETDVDRLMMLFGIGRKKLLKLTNELKKAGYLNIVPIRGRGGKIIDKEWRFYAESQEIDFLKPIIRDAPKGYDGAFHQDALFAYVGENQTVVEGHHHNLNTNSSQKEENKDLKTLTHTETKPVSECENVSNPKPQTNNQGSEFSLPECLKYVEKIKSDGAFIHNPQGLAITIFKSGEADPLIRAILYPEKIPTEDFRDELRKKCPRCYGYGMEYIFAPDGTELGVRANCKHQPLEEGEYLYRKVIENLEND